MAEPTFPTPTYVIFIFLLTRLMSALAKPKSPWPNNFITNNKISTLELAGDTKLRRDPEALESASTDFGHMTSQSPAAVLRPASVHDIAALVKTSHSSPFLFTIAARGHGHSVRGQAMAPGGVVIDMRTLINGTGVRVFSDPNSGSVYADVGGGRLWADVLRATLAHGLSPTSWTDYLYLTVGGTLSNAGISGTTFRHGPQISNVHELDVVTGKGEIVTCSPQEHPELFYGVLGGLGQFGIITRARIVLDIAPKRVKWVRMLYSDFKAFTRDQESLISIKQKTQNDAVSVDYVEGSLLLPQAQPNNWRSSFFPTSDHSSIMSLVSRNQIIYCLEVAKFYNETNDQPSMDKEIEVLFRGLDFIPGFMYEKDVSYVDFLDRVRSGELKLQSQQQWDVPHPWLNLFVPKSKIHDFDSGVFRNIVLKNNITTGPVLVYPMLRNKWDCNTSAVIPEDEDDVFYTVGFLHSSRYDDFERFDNQNREVLEYCEEVGIIVKQYMPSYESEEEWKKHYGTKWRKFQERKARFDPKMILAPGQRIFRN